MSVTHPNSQQPWTRSRPKPSWYSILKENPEALARFKECANEYCKVSKPSPEAKKRANAKYYRAHRDKIIQATMEYEQKERAKEYSPYMNNKKRIPKKTIC